MKKLTFVLLFAFFVIPEFVSCQHSHVDVDINLPKRFKKGDRYYASNYKGMKSLMFDLRQEDCELYGTLLPQYQVIENKQIKSVVVASVAGVSGLTMVFVGMNNLVKDANISDDINETPSLFQDNSGLGLFFAGGLTVLVGGVVSFILAPDENDFYQFLNTHNQFKTTKKLEWEIGLKSYSKNEMGISLALRF